MWVAAHIMRRMTREDLLWEIEAFLRESGMGESYFGQAAVGNSKLVMRLREGRSIEIDTADRIKEFMRQRRDPAPQAAAE